MDIPDHHFATVRHRHFPKKYFLCIRRAASELVYHM